MTNKTSPTLFHCLTFDDVPAAIDFMLALGFTERACYRDDEGAVAHAQYAWGEAGGVMFGGSRPEGDPLRQPPGAGTCYCVVATGEEVDDLHRRALAAGGTSLREPGTPDYGGRECTIADLEGNLWSFGTYPGA